MTEITRPPIIHVDYIREVTCEYRSRRWTKDTTQRALQKMKILPAATKGETRASISSSKQSSNPTERPQQEKRLDPWRCVCMHNTIQIETK